MHKIKIKNKESFILDDILKEVKLLKREKKQNKKRKIKGGK